MINFTYSIPTKIYFGKDQISHLAELAQYGSTVLLVYGGGSIKKSGLYDKILAILHENGLTVVELSGVEPNPRVQTVRRGIGLCREHGVSAVLAVGGGSAMDCGKMVAAGACYGGDVWELVLDRSKIKETLPCVCVATMAATGSEMDQFAVISDMTKNEKWGGASDVVRPKMGILDPTLTYSVPPRQTSAGTADIMSHTFENYFTNVKGATLQSYFCEAILKVCMQYGPIALNDPENYEARANLLWASSLAINGLVSYGATVKWSVHPIEHELSAFYDVTHGEGLAVMTPVWMRYVAEKHPEKKADFARYARNVLGICEADDAKAAELAFDATERFFFETMKMPRTLRELGITDKANFDKMAEKAGKACTSACFVELSAAEVRELYERAF